MLEVLGDPFLPILRISKSRAFQGSLKPLATNGYNLMLKNNTRLILEAQCQPRFQFMFASTGLLKNSSEVFEVSSIPEVWLSLPDVVLLQVMVLDALRLWFFQDLYNF